MLFNNIFNRKASEASHRAAFGVRLFGVDGRVCVPVSDSALLAIMSMVFRAVNSAMLVSEHAAQPVSPLGGSLDPARGRAFGVRREPFFGSPNSCLMLAQANRLATKLV